MIWGYTAFLDAGSPPRPLRLGVRRGKDCVFYEGGQCVLPSRWWEEVWSHARVWNPRFCYWYGNLEDIADEACLSGRYDVAVIVLSLYTWLLVEYFYMNVRSPRSSSGVDV